jgi:hypothetical protein
MFLFWGREVYLGFYVGDFPMFQMMSEHFGGFIVARFGYGLSRDGGGLQPITNYRIKKLQIDTNCFI